MRGLQYRTLLLIVIFAALAGLVYWIRDRDPRRPLADIPPVNSKGYIAALMEAEDGERQVVITPEGAIKTVPGKPEYLEKEFDWRPDGGRVVFTSNRASDGSFQMFEWRPDKESEPFQLSPNGASRQNPWFTPDGSKLLCATKGNILAFSYKDLRSEQVMPPSEDTQQRRDEQGNPVATTNARSNKITEVWSSIAQEIEGDGFVQGFTDPKGRYFAGVFSTARGPVFVRQDLEPADDQDIAAKVFLGGESIQVSMSSRGPVAVVAVSNFFYPVRESIPKENINPDGSTKKPFVNALMLAELAEGKFTPIFFSPDDKQELISPAISPDGTQVAVVLRTKAADTYVIRGLAILPVERAGIAAVRVIANGKVSDPAWGPDGQSLTFVRDGDIWTVHADGSTERNVTNGKGKFRSPRFSPMR